MHYKMTRHKYRTSRKRRLKMIDFSCQIYLGSQASFNPVLARTLVQKVAKFSHISHKQLIDPSMRSLMAAFESIPQHGSI
jgi:hypothetical protein